MCKAKTGSNTSDKDDALITKLCNYPIGCLMMFEKVKWFSTHYSRLATDEGVSQNDGFDSAV